MTIVLSIIAIFSWAVWLYRAATGKITITDGGPGIPLLWTILAVVA